MNKLTKIFIICVALLGSGCKVELEVNPALYSCVDFRDGETWEFDNRTAHNGVVTGNGTGHLSVIDTNGTVRVIKAPIPDYLKCKKIKNLPRSK